MFVGHYGVAYAARGVEKRIPLWAYFVAVQWVDILWTLFVYFGLERVHIQPGVNPSGPYVFDYYPYTHSLMAAIGWSALAYGFYRFVLTRRQGSQLAAGILALTVFSHWVLDFIVHQPDLDLVDESHKVGLGLWNYPYTEISVELLLLFAGLAFYLKKSPGLSKVRRIAMVVFCLLLAVFQVAGNFGPPPQPAAAHIMLIVGFVIYWAFAGIA